MDMNNEMDELFRKAGEDYPLNLGKPDWDAVAGKLHTDTGDLGPGLGLTAAAPRNRRRFLWLLLLLLPVGIYGLMNQAGGDTKSPQGTLRSAGSGQPTQKPAGAQRPASTAANESNPSSLSGESSPALSANAKPQPVPSAPAGDPATNEATNKGNDKSSDKAGNQDPGAALNAATERKINPVSLPEASPAAAGRRGSGLGKSKGTVSAGSNPAVQAPETRTAYRKPAGAAGSKPKQGKRTQTGGNVEPENAVVTGSAPKTETTAPGNTVLPGDPGSTMENALPESRTGSATDTADARDSASPLADIIMSEKANAASSPAAGKKTVSAKPETMAGPSKTKKPVTHPSIKKERGFYAGITGGPDFSTVKFQSLKNTGYSFGLVAGYRISHRFSVETGINWDRKKYYSDGAYFDKSRTGIPSSVDVTYIDGYCDMFEIPVTLRYDLSSGKKGRWYAAAGLSSYLMKNENYLYGAVTNGNPWSRYVDYKNSGNNFLSIAQFSLGYEYGIGTRTRIRVEPYFKAPLRGVGIGSLPISSVGLTFGLIRSFR